MVYIALGIAVTTLLLVGYLLLSLKELRSDCRYLDYSINLAFYNQFVAYVNGKDEVTHEEQFNIAVMQENLTRQAHAIGLEFTPFQRPKSLSDPD